MLYSLYTKKHGELTQSKQEIKKLSIEKQKVLMLNHNTKPTLNWTSATLFDLLNKAKYKLFEEQWINTVL